MLDIITAANQIDPATAELLWTAAVSTLLLAAGGLTLAALPWTDRDIAQVDRTFRDAVALAPRRASRQAR